MAETFDAYEFGIRFTIKSDDTERDIKKISKALNEAGVVFQDSFSGKGINDMLGGLEQAVGKIKSFDESLFAMAQSLEGLSMRFARVGRSLLDPFVRHAREGLFGAAQIERGINKLTLMAKKKMPEMADTIYDEVLEAGLHTVQTTQQVTDLTFGLMTQKINPFTEEMKNIQLSTGETVTAIETLSDVASIMPYGMGGLTMGIRQALGEGKLSRMRGLGARLDLGEEQLKRYNKALKKAKKPQEKFNALVKELAEDYGGLAKAQENSFAFVIEQLDDIKDKFQKTFFLDTGILQKAADFLKEIQFYFIALLDDEAKLQGIKDAMNIIADRILDIARSIFEAYKGMIDFVSANPWLIEMAFNLGLIATGASLALAKMADLASVTANVLVVMSNFKSLNMAESLTKVGIALKGMSAAKIGSMFASMGASIASMAAAAAPVLAIIAGLAAIAGVFAFMITGGKDLADVWDRLKMIFQGLKEMISSLEDGTASMSAETAIALEEMGLLDLVVKLTEYWVSFKAFFIGIWKGLKPHVDFFMESVLAVWNEFWGVISAVGELLGTILGLFFDMSSESEGTAGSWEKIGEVIGHVAGAMITVTSVILRGVEMVLMGWRQLILAIVKGIEEIMYQLTDLGLIDTDYSGISEYRMSVQTAINEAKAAQQEREEKEREASVPTKENLGIKGQGKNSQLDEKKLAELLGAEMRKQPIVLNGRQLNEGLSETVESETERAS